MDNTELIILAAGKGTRMNSELPKCLVSINGVPMINRLLSNVAKRFVNRPIIVVGHKSEEVRNHLGDSVRYVDQTEQKGTAHATIAALGDILPTTENVVVLYSDHPFVSEKTVNSLKEGLKKAPLVLATAGVEDFDSWRSILIHYGRVVRGSEGGISGIVEYKDASEEQRLITSVNVGCYAFSVEWARKALQRIKSENVQGEFYLTDIIKIARDEGVEIVEVKIDPKEAIGINRKEDLIHAEKLNVL